jgi:hypothetical protein
VGLITPAARAATSFSPRVLSAVIWLFLTNKHNKTELKRAKKAIKMKQTKQQSFIESITNVLFGYGIALASQLIIFPLYGVNLPLHQNMLIGLWFTLISITRSYLLRRWFTGRRVKL